MVVDDVDDGEVEDAVVGSAELVALVDCVVVVGAAVVVVTD